MNNAQKNLLNPLKIVEVGPRDGLQNEDIPLSADIKIDLINRLSQTGLRYIEAGAFVSPKWVPQMAQSDIVFQQIEKPKGLSFPVLVPNILGFERALAVGAREVAVFIAASERFSQENTNCSIEESLTRIAPVFSAAKTHAVKVRAYISCVIACPYEGEIAPEKTRLLAKELLKMGAYEISLGDTIGVAKPEQFDRLLTLLLKDIPPERLAMHCHDTHGRALESIEIGLQKGLRAFDSSFAGLGGCPYATDKRGKKAAGNLATEKLISFVHKRGFKTGIDEEKLSATADWFCQATGIQKRI